MDLEQTSHTLLCESIDSFSNQLSRLPTSTAAASQIMCETLLMDGRLFICGTAMTIPLTHLLSSALMNKLEHDRPSLPAINLSADLTLHASIAKDSHHSEIYSKQLRALGHEGDLCICFSTHGTEANIIQAIQTAHDKGMRVIVVYGGNDGHLHSLLQPSDIEIKIQSNSSSRILETMLVTINTVCALIEQQIFGVS